MTTQIVEIIGRSTQGVTQPFICRGTDDAIYFVKGFGAGKRSLVCEWVAGNLALRLGLPIAPFEIVDVPDMLIQLGSRSDLRELGAGLAFGSRKLFLSEFNLSNLVQIPIAVQRDVLAFDLWIRNADRTQTLRGGNPNLFVDQEKNALVMIDHNQAFEFEFDFDFNTFTQSHVFHRQLSALQGDWVEQEGYRDKFMKALASWPEICNTLPDAWRFIDVEQTLPLELTAEKMLQTLLRCQNENFWRMT